MGPMMHHGPWTMACFHFVYKLKQVDLGWVGGGFIQGNWIKDLLWLKCLLPVSKSEVKIHQISEKMESNKKNTDLTSRLKKRHLEKQLQTEGLDVVPNY